MAQADRVVTKIADQDDIAAIDADLTFVDGHYIVIDAIRAQDSGGLQLQGVDGSQVMLVDNGQVSITGTAAVTGGITADNPASQLRFFRSGTERTRFSTSDTILDISPMTDAATDGIVRLFRSTSTTGAKSLQMVAGDGSGTLVHQIGVNAITVFNEQGADLDFRIEGDTDASLFYLDASTDRVGIGTSTPAAKLHVAGAVDVDTTGDHISMLASGTTRGILRAAANTFDLDPQPDAAGDSTIRVFRTTNTSGTKTVQFLAGNNTATVVHQLGINTATVFNEAGSDLDFRIEGDTDQSLFSVDASTDRVGIGTGAPGAKLHVAGAVIIDTTGDHLELQASSTKRGLIRAAANTFDLDPQPDAAAASTIRIFRTTNTSGTKTVQYMAGDNTATVVHQIGINTATVFNEPGSDLDLRIEGDTDANLFFVDASTDRVGIGTATPGVKFDVSGAARAQTVAATNTGEAMALGGANASTYINIAGTRSYFGYDGANIVIQGGSGKGINFAVDNATFGSGTVASIDTTGNLTVINGLAAARTLSATGDLGGAAGSVRFTNISDVTANSTGVGTIKFKGATSRDTAGFIKIYIAGTAYYVPVFSAFTG